jgi:hypothetical protein
MVLQAYVSFFWLALLVSLIFAILVAAIDHAKALRAPRPRPRGRILTQS